MTADEIQRALAHITAESDPTLKHLKLASLVSAGFRERGIELVVVGGSAIEFYTEGAYASGDLDLCVAIASTALTVRLRQEIMARFGARGGPRSWQVAGAFVDVLASFENSALQGEVETDWLEVRRLAESTAYDNWNEIKELVHGQAQALPVRNPCDSDE